MKKMEVEKRTLDQKLSKHESGRVGSIDPKVTNESLDLRGVVGSLDP
jgi:hypothetical protein